MTREEVERLVDEKVAQALNGYAVAPAAQMTLTQVMDSTHRSYEYFCGRVESRNHVHREGLLAHYRDELVANGIVSFPGDGIRGYSFNPRKWPDFYEKHMQETW